MDIKRIEEYNFSHGLHRDNPTGKFYSLQPHTLGRPLTHEEMDYNMLYMEQTLGGYKIFGSNADTSLSDADVDKSLVLHRITPQSEDYARYIADGYFSDNELIWIPSCCGDSDSGQPCTIGVTALVSGQASQGADDANIIVFVTGLQGAPSFSINGIAATPSAVNGNQYTFNGYGAGTYSIIVVDTGVTDYVCDANATVVITEEINDCEGFAVSLQVQNSGSDEELPTCELESLTVLSYTQQVPFGDSTGSAVLQLNGSWTGPLIWSISLDGQIQSNIQPQTVSSNTFNLSGLSAGNWTIFVIDSAIPGNTCNEFTSFIIDEEGDPCSGFGVTLQSQNSGSDVDPCETFGVTLQSQNSGSDVDPDPCSTFSINTNSQDSGGDIDNGTSNSICQDFQISLNLVLDPTDQPTGEITLNIPAGNWGTLNVDYTTGKAFEPDTIWTSVDNVVDNQIGGYTLSPFPTGDLAIRVIESNNDCGDIEFITMPQIL
jgi:hypothetical protein